MAASVGANDFGSPQDNITASGLQNEASQGMVYTSAEEQSLCADGKGICDGESCCRIVTLSRVFTRKIAEPGSTDLVTTDDVESLHKKGEIIGLSIDFGSSLPVGRGSDNVIKVEGKVDSEVNQEPQTGDGIFKFDVHIDRDTHKHDVQADGDILKHDCQVVRDIHEHKLEVRKSHGTPKLEVKKSDGASKLAVKKSDGTPKLEVKKSDGTPKLDIKKSDGAHKLEVKKSDSALKLEVKKSDGAPKLEVKKSDGAPKLEVKKSYGTPNLEVKKSDGTPKYEVKMASGTPKLEVKKSDGAVKHEVKTASGTPKLGVKKSDGTPKHEIKSDSTPKYEVKMASGTPKREVRTAGSSPKPEVKKSYGNVKHEVKTTGSSPKPEVKQSDGTIKHEVKRSYGISKREVRTAGSSPKPEVKKNYGNVKHEVKTAFDTPIHEVKTAGDTTKHEVKTADDTPKHEVKTAGCSPKHEVKKSYGTPKLEVKTGSCISKHEVKTAGGIFNPELKTGVGSPKHEVKIIKGTPKLESKTTGSFPKPEIKTACSIHKYEVKKNDSTAEHEVKTVCRTPKHDAEIDNNITILHLQEDGTIPKLDNEADGSIPKLDLEVDGNISKLDLKADDSIPLIDLEADSNISKLNVKADDIIPNPQTDGNMSKLDLHTYGNISKLDFQADGNIPEIVLKTVGNIPKLVSIATSAECARISSCASPNKILLAMATDPPLLIDGVVTDLSLEETSTVLPSIISICNDSLKQDSVKAVLNSGKCFSDVKTESENKTSDSTVSEGMLAYDRQALKTKLSFGNSLTGDENKIQECNSPDMKLAEQEQSEILPENNSGDIVDNMVNEQIKKSSEIQFPDKKSELSCQTKFDDSVLDNQINIDGNKFSEKPVDKFTPKIIYNDKVNETEITLHTSLPDQAIPYLSSETSFDENGFEESQEENSDKVPELISVTDEKPKLLVSDLGASFLISDSMKENQEKQTSEERPVREMLVRRKLSESTETNTDKPILETLTFGASKISEASKVDESRAESDTDICVCLLCDRSYPGDNKDMLAHLVLMHKFVIADVNFIANLPAYLRYWKARFQEKPFSEFCSKIVTNNAQDEAPKEEFHLLCDALPEDKNIREHLQRKKLESVLAQQQKEREEAKFCRQCLFCKQTFCGNRAVLFDHLLRDHTFHMGQPDNLVFTDELFDLIQSKLDNQLCLFCEKSFKDKASLREHMRKKQHRKINPKNKEYDRFYIVNYMEMGKNWESLQSEDNRLIKSTERDTDEEEEWSGWIDESESKVVCLFCDTSYVMQADLQEHMKNRHNFDLLEVNNRLQLNFYQKVKLINYIRRQVYHKTCYDCHQISEDTEKLLAHFDEFPDHIKKIPDAEVWDQPQYFFPTYEDDCLLCQLDDDDEGAAGDALGVMVISETIPVTDTILKDQKLCRDLLKP